MNEPTLVERLRQAKTLDELDEIALTHDGYWTPEEERVYRLRSERLLALEGDLPRERRWTVH